VKEVNRTIEVEVTLIRRVDQTRFGKALKKVPKGDKDACEEFDEINPFFAF
jgi:hypothetical protein